jgi:predicted Zn-dependent protease
MQRLATNSSATFGDKLDYLNLLSVTKNPNTEAWLTVLEQQAKSSPVDVMALGRWLYRAQGPTNTLTWLSSLPANLQTNQPVPMVITDCQIATKDWQGLLASVQNQDWGESEALRISLESLAHRSLGQKDEATLLWKHVRRESARRLDQLYRLTQLTGAWGWAPERKEVLTEIVSEFPREKWATKLLIDQICEEGETGQLEQLLAKLSTADPESVGLKSSLARVMILRKNQLETAYRLAKEAYDKTPDDPVVLSTYAYSLSIQGKHDEALSTLQELKPESIQIPWVAACYGVIQAQSGNRKAAREPLERAQSAKLLPEEMALVRNASATLNTAQVETRQ